MHLVPHRSFQCGFCGIYVFPVSRRLHRILVGHDIVRAVSGRHLLQHTRLLYLQHVRRGFFQQPSWRHGLVSPLPFGLLLKHNGVVHVYPMLAGLVCAIIGWNGVCHCAGRLLRGHHGCIGARGLCHRDIFCWNGIHCLQYLLGGVYCACDCSH